MFVKPVWRLHLHRLLSQTHLMNMQGLLLCFLSHLCQIECSADTGSNSQTSASKSMKCHLQLLLTAWSTQVTSMQKCPHGLTMWIMDKFVIWAYVGIPLNWALRCCRCDELDPESGGSKSKTFQPPEQHMPVHRRCALQWATCLVVILASEWHLGPSIHCIWESLLVTHLYHLKCHSTWSAYNVARYMLLTYVSHAIYWYGSRSMLASKWQVPVQWTRTLWGTYMTSTLHLKRMMAPIPRSANRKGQKTGQATQSALCCSSFTSSHSSVFSVSMRCLISNGPGSIWRSTKAETVSSSHSPSAKHISSVVSLPNIQFWLCSNILFRYCTLLSVWEQKAALAVSTVSLGTVDPAESWKPNRLSFPKSTPRHSALTTDTAWYVNLIGSLKPKKLMLLMLPSVSRFLYGVLPQQFTGYWHWSSTLWNTLIQTGWLPILSHDSLLAHSWHLCMGWMGRQLWQPWHHIQVPALLGWCTQCGSSRLFQSWQEPGRSMWWMWEVMLVCMSHMQVYSIWIKVFYSQTVMW